MALDSSNIARLYEESKFWLPFISGLWGIFKVIAWVKDIREKDLKGLQATVEALNTNIQKQSDDIGQHLDKQTNALASVFKENFRDLKDDIRYYNTPKVARARK